MIPEPVLPAYKWALINDMRGWSVPRLRAFMNDHLPPVHSIRDYSYMGSLNIGMTYHTVEHDYRMFICAYSCSNKNGLSERYVVNLKRGYSYTERICLRKGRDATLLLMMCIAIVVEL